MLVSNNLGSVCYDNLRKGTGDIQRLSNQGRFLRGAIYQPGLSGYLVVDWESNKNKSEWVTSRLCQSPKHLQNVLRSCYEEYQGYLLTDGYKRDLLPQEDQEIKRMGAKLADLCEMDA